MTPYAVLMVKPGATDEVVRAAYHVIAKRTHPDARSGKSLTEFVQMTEDWYCATEAYSAIKTDEKRKALEQRQKLLSGLCSECRGYGVVGWRVRVCDVCDGEGRLR